jgi:hypothetical protein
VLLDELERLLEGRLPRLADDGVLGVAADAEPVLRVAAGSDRGSRRE